MTETNPEKLPQADIGILGGTGLYQIDGIQDLDEVKFKTPFGECSDSFVTGSLEGKKVAFLSRHGRSHRFLPSEINYQANIYGFKMLGVDKILSINSVGSLKEDIRPTDIVIPDQFFDRTRRPNSFFGKGVAAHISFADPVCAQLSSALYKAGKELGVRIHPKGIHICIEGPAFSTRAESHIYRSWSCDVIGMTSATEARLSREAEICYATMNLVTDYDVWHASEEPVSVEMILENMKKNINNAKTILKKVIAAFPEVSVSKCACNSAMEGCIVTQSDLIPQETKEKLRHIVEKYLGQ